MATLGKPGWLLIYAQNNVNPHQANILQTKSFNILPPSQFNNDNITIIKSLRRPQLLCCATRHMTANS